MGAFICPQGHSSDAGDYCDVCGAPIGVATAASTAAAAPPPSPPKAPLSSLSLATKACPNCHASNSEDSLFCEDCGYDFTTGQLPAPVEPPPPGTLAPPPVPPVAAPATVTAPPAGAVPGLPSDLMSDWVAELWVDPDWYASEGTDAPDPCPSSGLPKVISLPVRGALIGRTSKSRTINPEIEAGADSSVSHRHAQLTLDAGRWYVEDLDSTNGTYAAPAGGPLPTTSLVPGQRHELKDNERIYVGAWTRLVIRKATAAEKPAPAP